MPLDWHAVVEQFSNVQRLVHLAARYDAADVEQIRRELLRARRASYEQELEIQAGNVGCAGRRAGLRNNETLSKLNEMSLADAQSIVNTYNYYLANEIKRARQDNPRGNRHYYAARIRRFDEEYWKWKDAQIANVTDKTARALAQQEFYRMNANAIGFAILEPRQGVCPVCVGWINRGFVPLRVALNNPPPYHVNCPHTWDIRPKQVEDCEALWMGE